MRSVLIIQARMNSSRLPGKILMKAAGKTLLEHLVSRMRRVPHIDSIWIATTDRPDDDAVEGLGAVMGVPIHRGSEADVLDRYYGCARAAGADVVLRMTGDCPLADPEVTGRVLREYLDAAGQIDYASNTLRRTYPRGLDCEVFSYAGLEKAWSEAVRPEEREHVTPFLYRHPERFRLWSVEDAEDHSDERWTVDTPEDFELVRRIFESSSLRQPFFGMKDVLALLDRHPEWKDINRHVEQKKLGADANDKSK